MDKFNRTDEYGSIGRCKISRLLFADNLVLQASSEFALLLALSSFGAVCDIAGMKINISKNEILHLLRNHAQCYLQGGRVLLKVESSNVLGSQSRMMKGKTNNWMFD